MIRLTLFFFLGFVIAWFYEATMLQLFGGQGLIIGGYRLHHSLYGLLFILLGIFTHRSTLMSFGVGIIVQHTATDGLWFLTKEVMK
jgi:hypothetical protein